MNLGLSISLFIKTLYITSLLKYTYCSDNCTKVDVLVTGNVENEGFHRDIKWLIEIDSKSMNTLRTSGCNIALKQDIPSGLYVNSDQIADLMRVKKVFALVEGKVNIETPMHLSDPHVVYIYNNNSLSKKISLELPIHLRYQRAQITGGYGKVELPASSLFVKCNNDITFCGRNLIVEAPCSFDDKDICRWNNISYQDITNDIEMLVPIGDLDHYPLVSIVTLLVSCAGCIYILFLIVLSSIFMPMKQD